MGSISLYMRSKAGGMCFEYAGSVIIMLVLMASCLSAYSQYSYEEEEAVKPENTFLPIYEAAWEKTYIDPLIQNGVFYDNPYYNAKGHPYIGDGSFGTGDVIYRNKRYSGVDIKYDIYNQKVILGKRTDAVMQMNLLETGFISGFKIDSLSFIKADFEDEKIQYYQVVAETDTLSCYYYWFKTRTEVREPEKPLISNFSEQKRKNYLLMDGEPSRYKNNRTFVALFPKSARSTVKNYLKRNGIFVNHADLQTMEQLIRFCNTAYYKES